MPFVYILTQTQPPFSAWELHFLLFLQAPLERKPFHSQTLVGEILVWLFKWKLLFITLYKVVLTLMAKYTHTVEICEKGPWHTTLINFHLQVYYEQLKLLEWGNKIKLTEHSK